MIATLVPLLYFPPISFYRYLLQNNEEVLIEKHEHFIKQTFRNRCSIYGANGKLNLSIPTVHEGKKAPIRDIKINYDQNWQKIHWKSIESAYRSSPYFEFYEDQIRPLFNIKETYLCDFTSKALHKVNEILGIDLNIKYTSEYKAEYRNTLDLRNQFNSKKESSNLHFKEYHQVFEDKTGFMKDLSIIDLLFNEGPGSINYINESIHAIK